MRHLPQSVLPSTLSGIKRLAKSISRQDQIPHFQALDVVAQRCGYENFHHARRTLERAEAFVPFKHSHSIFLSAYWRDASKKPVDAGLETLKIELPRPLLSFLLKHQCSSARNLEGFYIEYEDHVEMRSNADSQERARKLLYRAALTLQFIEASGLRPATTKLQRKSMKRAEALPRIDHQSRWVAQTGQWIVLDEPYEHVLEQPYLGAREAWVTEQNLHWARPAWNGLYYPGRAIPHLIAADRALLDQVVGVVESLPSVVAGDLVEWAGVTQEYWSQFVSPARQAAGTKRKPRLGTTYGTSKNAVEYVRRVGHRSLWRPDRPMSLANHVVVGEEFKRLYLSPTPYAAHRKLGAIRSELEDWMYAEDRWEERESTENDVYYGGEETVRYQTVEDQLMAVDRVHSILVSSYPDCTPLRSMLKNLAAARVAMVGASGR
ncbi:DUF5623 domain-containing protein [Pseudomonas sp. GCM10022186]|uniref:DUF5623 domain-containing protein n=1 Tax=Pseudomonas sp. GCM10022186 TaxID=3252650 RepID=UPI00360E1818